MKEIFEWAILVASVCVVICTMRKYWWAPIVGLIHEIPWWGYAIYVKSLPLMITAVLYTLVFAFSIRKWYKEKGDNVWLCSGCLEFTKKPLRIGHELLCSKCWALNRQEINHEERG